MPPNTRSARSARSVRLPSGYVDLTDDAETPPAGLGGSQSRQRQSPTPGTSGPAAKRLKRDDGTSTPQSAPTPEAGIEEIDLSEDKTAMQDVLQKQRAEAVRAQQKPEEKATTLNNFTCVICMDSPTDMTATSCGHLFCHTCLMEALIAGENRSGPNEPKRAQCPVCRKHINRAKASDIIPLLMKKGLSTQPRKSSAVNSTKEMVIVKKTNVQANIPAHPKSTRPISLGAFNLGTIVLD